MSNPVWEESDAEKRMLLETHINKVLQEEEDPKILVFVSSRDHADDLSNQLWDRNVYSDCMHAGRSQSRRLATLDNFKVGTTRVLVTTDLLSRGLDIHSISHVVNFDMPSSIEDYVHRIGRTSRGQDGTGHALTFFEYWPKHPQLAQELCTLLLQSDQDVPPELECVVANVASGRYSSKGFLLW